MGLASYGILDPAGNSVGTGGPADTSIGAAEMGADPAKQGGGNIVGKALHAIGDSFGALQHGVGYTIHGAKTGDFGEILRGAGIILPAAAGLALAPETFGASAVAGAEIGGALGQTVGDKWAGNTTRADTAKDILGDHMSSGLGGTLERLGANFATDPLILNGILSKATGGAASLKALGDTEAAGSAARGLTTLGHGVDNALPGPLEGIGQRTIGKVGDALDTAKAAVVPEAYRLKQLQNAGFDPERAAALNTTYETGRSVAQGVRSNFSGDFEAELAAAKQLDKAAGGSAFQDQVAQKWLDKSGTQIDLADASNFGPEGLYKSPEEAVRQVVGQTASNEGVNAFEAHLAKSGVPRLQYSAGIDAQPGIISNNDVPDAFSGKNFFGGAESSANPEFSALSKLYREQPSLHTGRLNQLYRQGNLITGQAGFVVGDQARNLADTGIQGLGDVREAVSLQRALRGVSPEAKVALGQEGAVRAALSPEQFDLWKAARDNNVLQSGYQADTKLGKVTSVLAAPIRAEGDTARLANFIDRVKAGATPAEAAAGTRATQYDFSDVTPLVAKARTMAVPGANFMAHNVPAMLKLAAENPAAIQIPLQAADQATQPGSGVPKVAQNLLTGLPMVSALTGNNPATAIMRAATGDFKGAGDTLGKIPSGPTPGGLISAAYKESQDHSAGQAQALKGVGEVTLPFGRLLAPAAKLGLNPSADVQHLSDIGLGIGRSAVGLYPTQNPPPKRKSASKP